LREGTGNTEDWKEEGSVGGRKEERRKMREGQRKKLKR